MSAVTFWAFIIASAACFGVAMRTRGPDWRAWGAASNLCLAGADAVSHQWPFAAAALIIAAFLAWRWWRRRRDKIKAWLSSKYEYIRAIMVRTLRERRVTRPVLQPQGG